jgi:DNA-binding NarL/FixJ family response regulator
MRGILRDLLTSRKDEVWEAVDGSEAQSVYAQCRPDWVIMDVRMSPVNGIEATRQILAHDPQARVVIVTQHDDADINRQAREAGTLAYFPKDNLQAVHRFVHATPPAHP